MIWQYGMVTENRQYTYASPETIIIKLFDLEIWALAVWGRARYLSVRDAPHNSELLRVREKKHFVEIEGQSGVQIRDIRFS